MRKITLTAIVGSTIVLLPLALPASTTNSHVANLVSRGSGSPAARWRARQAHRIPFATCTTTANDSFVALPGDDVAGGDETATLGGRENAACDEASAIGSGYGNSVASSGRVAFQSFIGGGALNAITEGNAFIGAGSMNAASGEGSAIVGGGQISTDQEQASRGNLAGGEDSFVGAGDLNVAGGNGSFVGAGGATYALGGATTPGNTADGVDSFIGAGDQNYIDQAAIDAVVAGGTSNGVNGQYAVIAGGARNQVTSQGHSAAAYYGMIGGGYSNAIEATATNGARYATIAGGVSNVVNGIAASIGGGSQNRVVGEYGMIPGGLMNDANGIGSFAAGTQAQALHNGAFVWSDDSGTAALRSSAPYQFLARASGGFYLYSNTAATVGVRLAAGSGSWASLSDRASKTDILPLDDAAILAKVAELPLSTWSYRSEDRGVRHVGPMAQDFYAAFRVGEDDRHITTIDEDGVALAAIKALAAKERRAELRNATLERKVATLTALVGKLARGR